MASLNSSIQVLLECSCVWKCLRGSELVTGVPAVFCVLLRASLTDFWPGWLGVLELGGFGWLIWFSVCGHEQLSLQTFLGGSLELWTHNMSDHWNNKQYFIEIADIVLSAVHFYQLFQIWIKAVSKGKRVELSSLCIRNYEEGISVNKRYSGVFRCLSIHPKGMFFLSRILLSVG